MEAIIVAYFAYSEKICGLSVVSKKSKYIDGTEQIIFLFYKVSNSGVFMCCLSSAQETVVHKTTDLFANLVSIQTNKEKGPDRLRHYFFEEFVSRLAESSTGLLHNEEKMVANNYKPLRITSTRKK